MPIQVKSEIGPLKRVLLQRPGRELEHLTPIELERLLFDDIPYLRGAQEEHDRFAELLRREGVEVVYLDELTAETIGGDPSVRKCFIEDFILASGSSAQAYRAELREYLSAIDDPLELVRTTMAGVLTEDLHTLRYSALSDALRGEQRFLLDPIPNLYFTRDPFASIGTGAAINHMYSVTRNRETLYASYFLQYHPDYRGRVPLYYHNTDAFSIEGGDVMNLSERVLAVGVSQRTSPEAIELLAGRIFSCAQAQIDTILALYIPSMRAFMHLDTVFTQADYDKFVIHPGILPNLRLFSITPGGKGRLHVEELNGSLEDVLKRYLKLDSVTFIRCGGKDGAIASQREQWNDASNVLCIRPGTVVTYDRNNVTNELLRENGIEVLEIPSSELSRGRGGPRCMSMPLWRESL